MWKAGGAKAAQGGNLDEVIAAAQKAIDNTRSVGIGLTPMHTSRQQDTRTLKLKMELWKWESDIMANRELKQFQLRQQINGKRMTDIVLPDYPFESGDEVIVLVSGLGATPVMELYVLYNEN